MSVAHTHLMRERGVVSIMHRPLAERGADRRHIA
jgi:hypothetical protein